MKYFKGSKLNARRSLLENPYAHLEQLEDPISMYSTEADVVSASRRSPKNQYAQLDGDGRLSATSPFAGEARRSVDSFENVERIAIDLQRNIWHERNRLWPNGVPKSAMAMLDPSKASAFLGYEFEVADTLGVYSDRPGKIAVAGQIDRIKRQIRISAEFDTPVQMFTAAHEVGHLLLHPHLNHLHRDRGLNGFGVARDRVELEADKFAVYFLLPEKLVRKEFESSFITNAFFLTEETAYALLGKPSHEFGKLLGNRRKLSRYLASAKSYNGLNFYSMAERFSVTVETMAIRLEELGIV